jgi:hypothetical protein
MIRCFIILCLIFIPTKGVTDMSFEPNQFRDLVRRVLNEMGPQYASDSAVELLMLTAAQETHLGRYLWQVNGPAKGVFQMEPRTESDLWEYINLVRPDLGDKIIGFTYFQNSDLAANIVDDYDSEANLVYQIMMARAYYLRDPEPLPADDDIAGLAKYYKRVWNTYLGAATVEEAIKNYKRFAQ